MSSPVMPSPHPDVRRSVARRVIPWVAALAFATTSWGCEKVEFEPVPADQVDAARKAQAETFATTVLSGWARDEYAPLGEVATEDMRKGQTEETQKKADKQLEGEIGSFTSLAFHQVQRTKPAQLELFRFKATFDKSEAPVEVRVVYDTDGKVAGFWVKPWKDALE